MKPLEELKSYYLTHVSEDFYLGLHSIIKYSKRGTPVSSQTWVTMYNKNHEFIETAYRVKGSVESELHQYLSEGWQLIAPEPFTPVAH